MFFGEMRYTQIDQEPRYSAASVFVELGGQMDLCLCASVLSIGELLQLLEALCAIVCKQKVTTETTVVNIIPQAKNDL